MTDDGPLGLVLGSAAADLLDDAPAGVVTVARHDPPGGGFVPAHLVDHRANLEQLVAAGCTHVVSVNSVGSLRTDWPVGTVVVPDDFFAPHVTPSIHHDALGHSVPGFDAVWRRRVVQAWNGRTEHPAIDGGVYAQTTGPRFETPAEVRFLATVADIVGMTVAAECILAKELGLAYAAVCVVDNLGNGLAPTGDTLTIEEFESGKDRNRPAIERTLRATIGVLTRSSRSNPPPAPDQETTEP